MSEILIDDFINSINKIEPQEGARERMLANIRQKSQKKKVVSFATIAKIVIPVAAGLIIALVGSMVIPNITDTEKSTKQEETETEGLMQTGNPFVLVEGPQDFESTLGLTIDAPESATDVSYYIISNQIANIYFYYNDLSYVYRASKVLDEIDGLYGEIKSSTVIDEETNATLDVVADGEFEYFRIIWQKDDITYSLVNTDGSTIEEMTALYGLLN